jgi:hypothetical protein
MPFLLSGTTIGQSNTDTDVPSSSGNGFTVTTGDDGIKNADFGTNDLSITGKFTVPATSNLTSTGGRILLQNGADLIFDGNATVNGQNVSSFPELLKIITSNNNGLIRFLANDPNNPAKVTFKDCKAFIHSPGGDWRVIYDATGNPNNELRTEGEAVYIMSNPILAGNAKDRFRMDGSNVTTINLQAKVTYSNLWVNIAANQKSLAGLTPVDVDGPEINASSLSIAQRVDLPNYDPKYVVGSFYPGAEVVLFGGAYSRITNCSVGMDMDTRFSSGTGVIEFANTITIKLEDSDNAAIPEVVAAHSYTAAYPTGYRAKGMTADIAGHSSGTQYVSAANEAEFLVMMGATRANNLTRNYTKFVGGTTAGAETQSFTVGSYGYAKQTLDIDLVPTADDDRSEDKIKMSSLPTTLTKAQAAALTGISITHATKTISLTEQRTRSEVYDYVQGNLLLEANIFVSDVFELTDTAFRLGDYNLSIDGVAFEGSATTTGEVRLSNDASITGGTYSKVVLVSGFTGTISFNNCAITEIENRTGNDLQIRLTGTSTEPTTLTATSGSISILSALTVTDAGGESIKLIAWDSSDVTEGNQIKDYEDATSHEIPTSGVSNLRLMASKRGFYPRVYNVPITSSNQELVVTLTASPFIDPSADFNEFRVPALGSIVDVNGTDTLRVQLLDSAEDVTAQEWRDFTDLFMESEMALTLLAINNVNGNNVYETTLSGIKPLMRIVQVLPSGARLVTTFAFIDLSAVPFYEYFPRDTVSKFKVESNLSNPLVDYGRMGDQVIQAMQDSNLVEADGENKKFTEDSLQAIERDGGTLSQVLDDTNELQNNQGDWLTSTQTAPTASQNAAAVRTELDTELSRIDENISAEKSANITKVKGTEVTDVGDFKADSVDLGSMPENVVAIRNIVNQFDFADNKVSATIDGESVAIDGGSRNQIKTDIDAARDAVINASVEQ